MSARIVYRLPDGGMAVVTPAPASRRPGESQESWLERVFDRSVPLVLTSDIAGTDYRAGMAIKRNTARNLLAAGSKFTASEPDSETTTAAAVAALDRDFRGAWQYSKQGGAWIDLPQARALHLARIRTARDAAFEPLDQDFARHDAQAKYSDNQLKKLAALRDAKAAEDQRQQLRDAPQSVAAELAAADTLEKLKQVWPAVVPVPSKS